MNSLMQLNTQLFWKGKCIPLDSWENFMQMQSELALIQYEASIQKN